jgi:serine/threonine-protein kinase
LAGHVLGTPEYMSPEHVQGGPIDFRSDVYALGCVIFEVFAGRALFQGTSPIDTLRRHLHDPLVFASDAGLLVPEPLVPVLTRALAKKADDRFPSVAELIEDLRAARAESALYAVLGDEPPLADLAAVLAPLSACEPPTERPREPEKTPRPGPTRAHSAIPRPSGEQPAVPTDMLPAHAAGPGSMPAVSSPARLVGFASIAVIAGVLAFAWWRGQGGAIEPTLPPGNASADPSPAPSTLAARPAPIAQAVVLASVVASPPAPVARADRTNERIVAAAPTAQPTDEAPAPAPAAQPVQAVALELPPPTTLPVAETGILSLLVVPPANVSIDGNALGVVSSRAVRLLAGVHSVLVEHEDYKPYPRKVRVESGTTSELVVDLSEKGVRAR